MVGLVRPPALVGDTCGRGSVGRASPCQGEGRGFESRRPLGGAGSRLACRRSARLFWHLGRSPPSGYLTGGGMAEWLRQGPAKPCTRVRFPLPPRGRLAQRESTSLTRKGSQVQILYRPPYSCSSEARFPIRDLAFLIVCHRFVIRTCQGQPGSGDTSQSLATPCGGSRASTRRCTTRWAW